MPNRHLDWGRLEAEFVTGEMSMRSLARREGISPSTMARRHRLMGDWEEKRAAYRASKTQKAYALLSDRDAILAAARHEQALRIYDKVATIFESQIPVWEQQVQAGKTPIAIRDFRLIADLMRLIVGEPTERKEERNVVESLHAFNPEQLASLERIARSAQPEQGAADRTPVRLVEVSGSD